MIAAFDLGGTFLRSAIVSEAGDLHDRETLRIPNAFNGSSPGDAWEAIIDRMARYVAAHSVQTGNAAAVVSFPGPVVNERPQRAPTISGSYDVAHIADALTARSAVPALFLNDVSAAAWYLLDHVNEDRFLVVTISSGIGSKFVDRGPAPHVFDDTCYSGEIGHTIVDVSAGAPACDCGGRGHLGAISSGRGTERLAQAIAHRDDAAFRASACARRFGATAATLRNEDHLVPAARAGDRWTWEVIRLAMRPLAQVLASITNAVGVQRIIVIGGFATEIGERYGAELTALLSEYVAPNAFCVPLHRLVTVWPADEDACLRGAAKYGLRAGCSR